MATEAEKGGAAQTAASAHTPWAAGPAVLPLHVQITPVVNNRIVV